jgi:hypothetical protein
MDRLVTLNKTGEFILKMGNNPQRITCPSTFGAFELDIKADCDVLYEQGTTGIRNTWPVQIQTSKTEICSTT